MKAKKDKVRIIPLGGLGSIGKNMTVFEYGEEIIIVDCGIGFPEEGMPGVDLLIPDFSYIIKNKKKLKGIIITHGHEDHIGAIPFLLKEVSAPIYATKLTIGLIQSRFAERSPKNQPVFIEISPRDIVHIGSFIIEFISVNHSIVDGVGLAIQTPVGTIIHTGDFKIEHFPVDEVVTDLHRFAEYGERGVLLLMSDSTNAEVEGYNRSEDILNRKLFDIFSGTKGRIFIASFASNISRIQQALNAAKRYNRNVIISGLTMQKNIEIAHSLGYLTFKEDFIVDIKRAKKLPHKKQVIICTGTQGEPMSALSRIANGTHKQFAAGVGDVVIITASIIPGNEKTVSNVINSLLRVGAEVYYDRNEEIHVSGHASQEELKLMIAVTKPKFFMPIHGEYRHLKSHVKIAGAFDIKPSGIVLAENGNILELTKDSFSKSGSLNLRKLFVDGNYIGELESRIIEERSIMSDEGLVLITLAFSNGKLSGKPEVLSRGAVVSYESGAIEAVKLEIEAQARKLYNDKMSINEFKALLKKSIKRIIYKSTRTNPLVELQILKI